MRFFLFLSCFYILFFYSCDGVTKKFKSYGQVYVDTTMAVNLDDMLQQIQQNPEKVEFTFFAPIEEVCQNAGCWVNVKKDNGGLLRIRFKNHFVIPIKTKIGSIAYFHGKAYWDTISVELQKHFAEDSKMKKNEISKIKEPRFELNFEADGIVVQDVSVSDKRINK